MNKPNVAFFTSAARGLAHYVAHLYPDIKKYANPYYVTYANQEVDDLAQEQAGKTYKLIDPNSSVSVLEVIRFLENKKIDLINVQVSDTVKKLHMQYFAILSYAKYMGIPICLTIHDVFAVESMVAEPSAVEMIYLLGDSFIVGNESEKDKLELYFKRKEEEIVVVPHGPYTLFDKGNWTQKEAKESLGLKNKKVILFFGQIRANKGLKYLIKALPLVIKSFPDVHLHISTDLHMSTPELNDYLNRIQRSGVKENVTLVKDYIPSNEVEKIFKAADVVVLPYTRISQSGVLNLAFGFKKPVVVSDVFFEARVINSKMGYCFQNEDYKSLAACISKIFSLPDMGVALGKEGYRFATGQTSWKQAAGLTNKAFEIALKKSNEKRNEK